MYNEFLENVYNKRDYLINIGCQYDMGTIGRDYVTDEVDSLLIDIFCETDRKGNITDCDEFKIYELLGKFLNNDEYSETKTIKDAEKGLLRYLIKAVKNRIINHSSIAANRKRIMQEHQENIKLYNDGEAPDYSRLNDCLALMNTEERELIKLKFYEQMTDSEISMFTGKKEGSVRMAYHRLLKKYGTYHYKTVEVE